MLYSPLMKRLLRVGFIGVGRPWRTAGSTGFGMAYEHADAYRALPGVRLAACADIVPENAKAFAEKTSTRAIYTDYRTMLRTEDLDMVSVCVWPRLHAPMTLDAIRAGVRAIHCEKPMALTYGESVAMTAAAKRRRVRLTFNHQRRFGAPYRLMRDLAWSGRVGKVQRLEAYCPNFYDWGTHWVDMLNMFNKETPAEWVIGQLDWRRGNLMFGAPCDNQGIFHFKYANSVHGLVATGGDRPDDCALRITGDAGIAELHWGEPIVRVWRKGRRWFEDVKVANELHGGGTIRKAIADAVRALRRGTFSQLRAENALRATEIIFAGYESSRRRARVDLPLTIKDNPLAAMVASGAVKALPKPKTSK